MNRLKELRTTNNFKQADIAQYLKIPTPTYCRYENGKYEMDYETLLSLSKFFKVSINTILGEKSEDLILIRKDELEELIKAKNTISEIEKRYKVKNHVEIKDNHGKIEFN